MDQQQMENMWKIMREHNLELVDDMSSEFKCIICKKILINACVAPCGCRFCVECVKEYLRDHRKCPGPSQLCDDELIDFDTDIQINERINKRIQKLAVKCPNIGCRSQIELNLIEDHLRICENQPESCPFFILGCEENKLENDQVRNHILMEIHSHTKLLINWIRDSKNETKSMRSEMDKLKADNFKMKEEMRSNEERTKNIIGNLHRRERENSLEIEILNEEMCALKNSNRWMKEEVEKLKDKQREQVSQSETKVKCQSQEIEQLKSELQIQSNEIEQLKQGCQQTESRFDEIYQQGEKCKMKLDEISQTSDVLKEESSVTRNSIKNIQEIIDQVNYEEIEWNIDNWPDKVRKAGNDFKKEYFSNHFFTSNNGYKICLSTFPGWDYFWIGFYILRGPFDDSLRWPFDRDLECSLINQKSGRAYQSISIKSYDYTKDEGLQKPSTERNKFAFNFKFDIPSNQIQSKIGLCENGQVFVKLIVKPTKHLK